MSGKQYVLQWGHGHKRPLRECNETAELVTKSVTFLVAGRVGRCYTNRDERQAKSDGINGVTGMFRQV